MHIPYTNRFSRKNAQDTRVALPKRLKFHSEIARQSMLVRTIRYVSFFIITFCEFQIGLWVIAHWKRLAKTHPMHT
jgi:hypothetical protein